MLLVALHLLPVLLLEFFVTHDGPSHVYNTYIMSRLLDADALNAQYFMFNPQPVPNWLGHVLLYFFNFFFSGNVSERILIGLYIIALAWSFRHLLLTVNPQSRWASWLIFPFIYSLYLYQGLFNFCIAIPILFYAVSYFIKDAARLSLKRFFVLTLLALLLYFSHIFFVILFALVAAVCLITEYFFNKKENIGINFSAAFFRQAGFLTLTLLACIVLAIQFIVQNTGLNESGSELGFSERLQFLFIGRPLITLDFEEEKYYAAVITSSFWIVLAFAFYFRIRNFKFLRSDSWLFTSLLILIIYFTVPDTLASGSFVSIRILMFFYLFMIVWICTNRISEEVKNFSMIVFSALSLFFLVYHYQVSENVDDEAREFISTSRFIPENSVVLPVSYSANWLHSNLSNYLGMEKNMILLDNYEAAMSHFPTQWKAKSNPYTGMNLAYMSSPCMDIERYEKITGKNIDYVIRWGFNKTFRDSCAEAVSDYLKKNYTHMFTSANEKAEVFKRKQQYPHF